MNIDPDFENTMLSLQADVTDRLKLLIEFLLGKGLSELDAINLILDMGELLLDDIPPTHSEIEETTHASR